MKTTWIILDALLIAGLASAAPANKPNVLFVAIDDLNDWIGCFDGNLQVKTPNLDKFSAGGGMVMFDAHAPAPICGPSRSALLTGMHAHKTGVYGNNTNLKNAPKAKDLVTLPEYFSQHGYHSLSIGKIFHRHPLPGETGGNKSDAGQWAFDEHHPVFPGIEPAAKKRPVNGLPNLPDEKPSYQYTAFDWGPTSEDDETKMMDYQTAQWAADQLETRDFDKPFFMAIGISKPHLTWYVPQKYFDLYPTLVELCGLPENPKNDGRSFAELLHHPDMEWNEPTLTTAGQGNHRIYDGRYSYISYPSFEQLYDHRKDPMEWTNLAHNPEYAEIKARLKAHLPEINAPESPRNPK